MPCLGSTKPIRNPGGGEVFPFPSAASEYLKNVVFISFPTLVHYFPAMKKKKKGQIKQYPTQHTLP